MAFDDPVLALRIPTAELGLRDHAAVTQRLVAADAHPAAPSARADDRTESELFEAERQSFAVAAALTIDQASHIAAECARWDRIDTAIARAADGQDLAVPVREDHGSRDTAVVPAAVDDQAARAPLRWVVARELPQAETSHVVQVQVADLSVALLVHVLARLADPGRVPNPRVTCDRLDDDAPCAF